MKLEKLLVNDRSQLRIKQSTILNVTNNKNVKFEKLSGNAIRFDPPHVCPSVAHFAFVVLFIPSFLVLSSYFYVSVNLVAVCTV